MNILAIEIETITKRLQEVTEPTERSILLDDLHDRLAQADKILKDYMDSLPK